MKIYYIRYDFYGEIKDAFISANTPKEAVSRLGEEYSVAEHNVIAVYQHVPEDKWRFWFA